jgi:flagellar protein FliS
MNPLKAYRETRVKTAGQGQLIVMLYDEAIRRIDEAAGQLDQGSRKLDAVHNAIVKAQDCITELMVSLDFQKGGELAHNLFSLYVFFNRQLLDANMKKDASLLQQVRGLLSELRDAWHQISAKGGGEDRETGSGGVNIAG